jgi:psiF repeat
LFAIDKGRPAMRGLVAFAAILLLTATTPVIAQQSQNAQQDRMKTCSTEAGGQKLTGDARKSFMSSCLSGKTTGGSGSTSGNAQQDKMKTCNQQAGAQKLAGDARKSFMSGCLKGQ